MVNIVNFTDEDFNGSELAILIKENAAKDLNQIKKNYADKIKLPLDKIAVVKLPYYKKFKVADGKNHLSKLIPALKRIGVKHLYIADANYAKLLLGVSKVPDLLGVINRKKYLSYGFNMMYGVNYRQAFYNETAADKLEYSIDELNKYLDKGIQVKEDPLTYYEAVDTVPAITEALLRLHKLNLITCDIETYGLDFTNCGIATISFGANKHSAISIAVDILQNSHVHIIRALLKEFFETYEGKIIYHNANFDVKVLIFNLWMKDLLDQEGLIKGLQVMSKNIHDTKLIAYLATNSTTRSELGLKDLSREYMGQYAIDVTDITQHSKEDILRYNADDAIATYYVYKKYYPKMVADNQLDTYNTIFNPSIKVILQMELSGMPMIKDRVKKASRLLHRKLWRYNEFLNKHPIIDTVEWELRSLAAEKANKKLKKLRKTAEDFIKETFNPNSSQQLATLVYGIMGYKPTTFTDEGAPSTKTSVLAGIAKQAKPEHKTVLRALIAIKEISIIVNTFIKAFIDKSVEKDDGRIYLHGSFNLGGTVSGRLSSSKPNMQNIPSTGSIYAKLIKSCFVAPDGWLMVGADFSSLEDRISALITKDPNKLKVYSDGYDGHCLRAYYYFSADMPDINPDSVDSINSIAIKYPKQRQDSKGPTFCLTYGGTNYALVETCGLPLKDALQIEENYHKMYEVSDQWVDDQIRDASINGYVTVAFGLRVRTPYLQRCVWGSSNIPKEARAEARTAGNALGQSYGMLNNRAGIEFQERCLNSPYALDIKPIAHIHDSQYFLIRNNLDVLHWFNKNLVECMEWQNSPEIAHPNVRLGGEVEVYYPSWAEKTVLPNNATKEEIRQLCKNS